MGFPQILHDNRLDDATPAASTTATGDYNVLNLRDWRPFTWWKPTALPATVTVDSGVTRAVDYFLLWTADVFSKKCQVQLQGSTTSDFSSGVTAVASTNLIDAPDDFSSASWTKRGTAAVTANDTLAPDGSRTADKITGIVALGVDDIYQQRDLMLPASNTYAPSVWIKRISTIGVLSIANPQNATNGEWRIDLSLLSDEWERLTESHAAVTVVAAFDTVLSASAGLHFYRYSGASALSFHAWRAAANAGATAHPWLNGETDEPFLTTVTASDHRYWRLHIGQNSGSSIPSIAIAAIGEALEVPTYLSSGFDPLGRKVVGQSNRSEGGQPLGRVIDFEEWRETLKFEMVTWSWLRNSFNPAWAAHLRSEPFGFCWDAVSYPDEVRLVQAGMDYKTPHRTGALADLTLEVFGVV